MKFLKDLLGALVGDAPPDNHTQDKRVRQGDVIFKEGDSESDKAYMAALDKGEPGFILNKDVKFKGEVHIGGKPPRESWVVSGPKATVIALSKGAVEPLIKALCAINGDDPSDYTATKSTIWIDMTGAVDRFAGLDK